MVEKLLYIFLAFATSSPMAKIKDELYYEAEQWLREQGFKVHDVHYDLRGAFVFSIKESGHPADDDYRVDTKKIYLPDKYQFVV